MGREYSPAIDMFVNEQRVFIGALDGIPASDLSIVIHGTGSPIVPTAQEIGLYFASNNEEVSSHFTIDQNGTIVQSVSLHDGAAANCCTEEGYDEYWTPYVKKYGNLNKCTISIEHCNNADNSLALSPKQRAVSFTLVGWLCKKYGISPEHIKTHASIDPQSRKNCPGNYPMSDLITAVTEGLQPMPTKTTTPEPTISESQVETDITMLQNEVSQEEQELAALRGLVVVKGPTVIE